MNDLKRTSTLTRQEQILEVMRREAGKGMFFVPTSFAEFFGGVELGSCSTLHRHIKAMIQEGMITLVHVAGIKKSFMLPMKHPCEPRSVVQRQDARP